MLEEIVKSFQLLVLFLPASLRSATSNFKIDGRGPRRGGEPFCCSTTFCVPPSMTNTLSKYLWLSGVFSGFISSSEKC